MGFFSSGSAWTQQQSHRSTPKNKGSWTRTADKQFKDRKEKIKEGKKRRKQSQRDLKQGPVRKAARKAGRKTAQKAASKAKGFWK